MRALIFLLFFGLSMAAYSQKLYGTVNSGGTSGAGTVFKMNTDGTGFTKIKDFVSTSPGRNPNSAQLTEGVNGNLYGLTTFGGVYGWGALYEYNYNTNAYRLLHSFPLDDGGNPTSSVTVASNGKLYGTGFNQPIGSGLLGNIFEYDLATDQYTEVHDFTIGQGNLTYGRLLEYNGKLYGLGAQEDGFNNGSIYSYDLTTGTYEMIITLTGDVGSSPYGGLALAPNGKMYGLTYEGSYGNMGAIFEFDPVAKTVAYKKAFRKDENNVSNIGANPWGTLMLHPNGKFYGTTQNGGSWGTLFEYDYLTNTLTFKTDFPLFGVVSPIGQLALGNDGLLYGHAERSWGGTSDELFTFNLTTNQLSSVPAMQGGPTNSPLKASDGNIYYTRDTQLFAGELDVYYPGEPVNGAKLVDFDAAPDGAKPFSSLTQAFNGKLYGTLSEGGDQGLGAIFTVDPSNDQVQTVLKFTYDANFLGPDGPQTSLTAHPNGKLYGTTKYGSYPGGGSGGVYEFDPANNTITKLFTPAAGSGPANYQGSLSVAPDGRLFGLSGAGGTNSIGTIYEVDLVAEKLVKKIDFTGANGQEPTGALTWLNGKFYGLTRRGGADNLGTLFEYDPGTNQLTTKMSFNTGTGVVPVGTLIVGTDARLYGANSGSFPSSPNGLLFSYNPATGQYNAGSISSGGYARYPTGPMLNVGNDTMFAISFGFVPTIYKWKEGVEFTELRQLTGVEGYIPPNEPYYPAENGMIRIRTQQSITVSAAPVGKIFGDTDFQITATASSTLPVSFGSSNPNVATIVNNKIHIVGTGTATIRVLQLGNYDFMPAPLKEITLNVSKKSVSVIADGKSKFYGEENPALTFTYSGFIDGDNSDVVDNPPAIFTTASQFSEPNLYSITVESGSDNNYTFQYTNAGLEVKKAKIVASAANKTKIYGAANPAFGIAYNGFVIGGDAEGDLDVTPTVSCDAIATSSPGEYDITLSGGVDDKYFFEFVSGKLTINKASQTITVDPVDDKTIGDDPFTISALSTSALPVTFTADDSGIVEITGNSVTILKAGTATVTASQPGDGNYSAADNVQFIIKVDKVAQTIAFDEIGIHKFGEAPFDLVATASSTFTVSFSSSNTNVATIAGNTVTIKSMGTSTITATQPGNSFYAPASATRDLVVDGPITGLNEVPNGTMFYPNPVKDRLHFEFAGSKLSVVVRSTTGAECISLTLTSSGPVDVSSLSQGLYLLQLTMDSGDSVVKRLIKL
jgi:uncharacterized repeat protein (TIGR03803 family)